MSAAREHRRASPEPLPTPARRPRGDTERRRRRRHLEQLRRDLLVDAGCALVLTVLVLIATAGLGVVALLELPLTAAVLLSFVLERRARRRARSTRPYRTPRPYTSHRSRRPGGG